MAIKKQVGLRIRELRDAAEMTQDELAAKIDKTTQTVGGFERGAFGPSIETIELLSDALNVAPAMFFPMSKGKRRPSKKDKAMAAIIAAASHLSSDDLETLRVIAEALYIRRNDA